MKVFLLALFLCATGARAHSGHSIAGAVTLSGILKSAVMGGKSIPLGGITSYYGYEAINFPSSTPVFCYGGVGLASNASVLGLSFGGNGSAIQTLGECRKAKDYTGGFLNLSLNYQIGSGSKDASVQASFGLGFDLGAFNKVLLDNFSTDPKRTVRKRTYAAAWHFIKYAGRATAKKLGKNYLWLKLLSLPLTPVLAKDWKTAINELRFTMEEMQTLEKRQKMFALKDDLSELFQNVRRDPAFYKCGTGRDLDCVDIYVDAFYIMEAIEEAMGECHSVSLGVNLASSYNLNIPFLNSKLNYSFGYSYFGIREELAAKKDTKLAAGKAYATHRFWTKNQSCAKIEETAAWSFGEFLAILGVGGK